MVAGNGSEGGMVFSTGGCGMEARRMRGARVIRLMVIVVSTYSSLTAVAASYRTANFIIEAPSPAIARRIGDAAEQYRHDLALEWTGSPLPRWSRPCPITARVEPGLGAGGATSFVFDRGEVFNWTMTIQGSEERILDSVLPHEITHTVFASHFRCPLPRWADEGACTTVEHPVERARQHRLLIEFLTTGRGIDFPRMFAMKEYPADVLPLYSQGYSLARYLIERGGRRKYVAFVGYGLNTGDWSNALAMHYGVANPVALQQVWLEWVRSGCPAPPASLAGPPSRPVTLADDSGRPRGQSPDSYGTTAPLAAGNIPSGTVAARQSIYALAATRGGPPIGDAKATRVR